MHKFAEEALGNAPAPSAITSLKVAENFLMPYLTFEESSDDSDEDASDLSDLGEGGASDEDAADPSDEGQNEDSDEGEGDSDDSDEGEGDSDDSDVLLGADGSGSNDVNPGSGRGSRRGRHAGRSYVSSGGESDDNSRVVSDDANQSDLAAGATETEE